MSREPQAVVIPRDLYYHEMEYVRGLEALAGAVLLFHRGGPWTAEDREQWASLTGETERRQPRPLCDFARKVTSR